MEEYKLQLEQRRNGITLFASPIRTLSLFMRTTVNTITKWTKEVISHPTTLYFVLPILVIGVVTSNFFIDPPEKHIFDALDANSNGVISIEEFVSFYSTTEIPLTVSAAKASFGPRWESGIGRADFTAWWNAGTDDPNRSGYRFSHGTWREVEYILADVIWWLGLGVLSSIGLGTGMHSGLFFLFPHIYRTCASSDACQNSEFWTYPTNIFYGPHARVFHCISPPEEPVSIMTRVIRVAPWAIIWGMGTAFGEIPPYALSYAAALQGKQTEELAETSKFDVLNRMKDWMLDKIKKYGFWAILLLAAWPNMAFDLCGMACGQFKLPFWTFFGATLIGKAFIKVNGQAAFFVLLFSGDNVQELVTWIGRSIERIVPLPGVQVVIEKAITALANARQKIAARAHGHTLADEESAANPLVTAMQWLVVIAVAWFAKSIIETFAQSEQEDDDHRTLASLEKELSLGKRSPDNEARAIRRCALRNSSSPQSTMEHLAFAAVGALLLIAGIKGSYLSTVEVGTALVFQSGVLLTVEAANPGLERANINVVRLLLLLPILACVAFK
jgi:membrane protein YqaA with SNARE-associated domain